MQSTGGTIVCRPSIPWAKALGCALALIMLANAEAAQPHQALAIELLAIERTVRNVPSNAESTLEQALAAVGEALGTAPKAPTSPEEAEQVSVVIATALARQNFLQPPLRKDWPSTLGMALVPRSMSAAELETVLTYSGNAQRADFIDRRKPVYFVDCDMGALLIISVAQQLGWDVRLVEVPDHNFVRWHLPDGRTANWDWTRWAALPNDTYLPDGHLNRALRQRGIYLRSFSATETRAYYLSLIGSMASAAKVGTAVLEEAAAAGASDPSSHNNLAWNYITRPDLASERSDVAISYALSAWSARPDYGNFVDTVACAFAARGDKHLALALEDHAIARALDETQKQNFLANRERITNSTLCK